MYEIELKARVENREIVIEKLNSFAEFLLDSQKDDVYWSVQKNERKIQARIRTETFNNNQKIYLTYKRKENRLDENGNSYEVNDEKECEISDSDVLETLFKDLGFEISIKKQKKVLGWQFGECHIELCTVPPLSDFLEIEIISEKNDEETVFQKRQMLLEILKKCDIPESKIEKRYYSEMLRELEK